MIIGALLDAGLSLDDLTDSLKQLDLEGYELRAEKASRRHLSGTSFFVDVKEKNPPDRHLKDILGLLDRSALPEKIRSKASSIFNLLAETEAAIHSTTPDRIHFHEVGAIDSIIDVIGALIGLEKLGISEIHASPINVGGGFVECRHGTLPVPAPATMKLLEGVPVYSRGPQAELVTPTGAILLKSLAKNFGPLQPQTIISHGYGAGKSEFTDWPNLLRVIIGEPTDAYADDDVVVMSANIDDMNPEFFEYVMELLFKQGALDVFFTSIQAKKSRPGTLLTLLCEPADASAMASILFSESTTFGVRYHREARLKLNRRIIKVSTEWGPIQVKIGEAGEEPMTVSPEFEDCKRIANANNMPLRQVYEAARHAAMRKLEE